MVTIEYAHAADAPDALAATRHDWPLVELTALALALVLVYAVYAACVNAYCALAPAPAGGGGKKLQ
jgi:hypothetical protein